MGVAAAVVAVGLVFTTSLPASAEVWSGKRSSDKIESDNEHSANVITDGCREASVRTIPQGGPYPAAQTQVWVGVDSTGFTECHAVARIVYVKTRTSGISYGPWADGGHGGNQGYTLQNIYRCYTEFVVQHKDGSSLYLRLYPEYVRAASQRPKACPAP